MFLPVTAGWKIVAFAPGGGSELARWNWGYMPTRLSLRQKNVTALSRASTAGTAAAEAAAAAAAAVGRRKLIREQERSSVAVEDLFLGAPLDSSLPVVCFFFVLVKTHTMRFALCSLNLVHFYFFFFIFRGAGVHVFL